MAHRDQAGTEVSVAYLAEVAQSLLDAAEAGLVQSTTGHAPPTHAYVCHGEPTGDYCCDGGELAVWIERMMPVDPGIASTGAVSGQIPQYGCVVLWEATYVVALHRCYPNTSGGGAAPSPAVMHAASSDLMIDLWALLTEYSDRMKAETLIPGGAQNCRNITLEEVTPAEDGPTGACAGWEFRVTVRCSDAGPAS